MNKSVTSKKIAICFSGHLRNFLQSPQIDIFNQNLNALKNQDHHVDLFFSIWNTYNTKTNRNGGLETLIDESSLAQLNATLLEIEDYSQVKDQLKLRKFHPTIEPAIPELISSDGILHSTSMYYKIHKANQLKQSYEKLHNFKYDVVVRYRANVKPNKEFNFDDVVPGYLYVTGSGFEGGPFYNRSLGLTEPSYMMQELFFYGDSHTMDVVCDVYNNLVNMYPKYGTTGPEQILYDWVVFENKIPTKPNSIGFSIEGYS